MTDPWKHRSTGMTCATCMWFAEKVRGLEKSKIEVSENDLCLAWKAGHEQALESVGDNTIADVSVSFFRDNWMDEHLGERPKHLLVFGRCRRHAPMMQGYPAVFGNDWCGDHKLDENSLSRRAAT